MLFYLHLGIVFNISKRLVDPEEDDDELAPHAQKDVPNHQEDNTAYGSATAHHGHGTHAIIASAAKDRNKGGKGDQTGHDDVHDLDDLQGDHRTERKKIFPVKALGDRGSRDVSRFHDLFY
jgi:hypothetical protein